MTERILLLLRHAKSSWQDARLDDPERPLNDRGRRTAPVMGALLAQKGWVPELIRCSTALRARQTVELLSPAMGYAGAVEERSDLYLAEPSGYLAALRDLDDRISRVMLVGHNPGLEDLVAQLAGREEPMPTAAVAVARWSGGSWAALREVHDLQVHDLQVHDLQVYRPKELD
jgi:phosphohistidine phosphatase